MNQDRRKFIKQAGAGALGLTAAAAVPLYGRTVVKPFFKTSLAQFSFASELFQGQHNTLEFPARAKNEYGLEIVEYVSMFIGEKVSDKTYLNELKQRSKDAGVKNHLIMIDDEDITDPDPSKRLHAVESHYKWVDFAKGLGCSSVRVNLGAIGQTGTPEEVTESALEGYSKLLEYGDQADMNVIVENHTGYSCNAKWLVNIMKQVNHKRAGVLPDFGNFCINRTMPETMDIAGYMNTKCLEEYDKYLGVEELMPYAKGVSAKSHKFDAAGNESEIDFDRMFDIIRKSGFKGIVGIEYEGGLMASMGQPDYLSNEEGIKATKKLLERVG